MKKFLATLSFLLVLFVCASVGAPSAFSKTLTISNLVPMSGGAAAWGIATDRGVRMAVDDINARGGLKAGKETYTIEVVTLDHRYVAGEALSAAKKIIRDGIKISFGLGAGILPTIQPVLEGNKILHMTEIGGGAEFTNAKNPLTFRLLLSGEVAYNLFLPKFVKMFGPIKIAFIHNNDDLARSDARVQKEVIEGQSLPIDPEWEFVERDAIDFSPVVTRVMAKKVDLVLNELTPTQAYTLVKQAFEYGYKGHMGIVRTGHSHESLVKTVGKEGLEGFITAVNWPPGKYPTPGWEEVLKKYYSKYKEEPVSNTLWGYAGAQFWATAVERAGTIDNDRVAKVMYDLETETIGGPTSMVGKTLGYGIKTSISYGIPFCTVKDGQLELIEILKYAE